MEPRRDSIVRAGEGERRPGVIDCLSTGFEQVNGMLWIVLLPVLMGLFLWRGPQLSAAPAVTKLASWYLNMVATGAQQGLDVGAGLLTQGAQGALQLPDLVQMLGGDTNLFSFLSFGVGIAGRGSIPSVPLGAGGGVPTLPPVGEPFEALVVAVALQVFGLLLGAGYLGLIGQRVRGEAVNLARLVRRVWGYWLSMLGFQLGLLIVMLGAGLATALLLGATAIFSTGAAEAVFMVLLAGWQVAGLWVTLFTFFLVDAAIVGELGPRRAVRSSVHVVSRNFWSAIAFIVLYLVISYGMLAVWAWLGSDPWAIGLAIIGNAYIASGLAAGSMTYYRTRVAALERLQIAGAR